MSEEDLPDLHAGICRALADAKRILIMYARAEEPRHVTALAEDLGLPQSTVSRHLQVLRQQALVTTERSGPSVIYGLADQRIITVLDTTQQMMIDAQARRQHALEAVPDA
jgi:DNA-binding transcriptional ArsR family regulator